MKEKKLNGMIIERHCVIDAESKQQAQDTFWGWSYQQKTFSEWIHALELGQTITIANFETDENGKYRHKKDLWIGTRHILTDADHIRGIEFNDKGEDVNPNGIEPFESETGLSELYPDLKTIARGVGQSVSSMSESHFIPHRRYRIAFEFDKLIRTREQYSHVLSKVALQFPIISPVDRHPAQPVFGNARKGFGKWAIMPNILSLDEYLSDFGQQQETPPGASSTSKDGDGYGTHNATQRKYRNNIEGLIADAKLTRHETNDEGTVRVDCPFNSDHKRDAFVKLDAGGFPTFKCHHGSCKGKGFNEMIRVTGIEVPYSNHHQRPNVQQADADGKTYTDEQIDTDTTDTDAPEFPMELFTGIFANYRNAMHEANPVPDSFLFATLKQAISASLGRAVFIKSAPIVYPVFFTGLVGDSSSGHKGVALKSISNLLSTADKNVLQMPSLTTEEGFIEMFVEPEPITEKIVDDNGNESESVTGYQGGWYPYVKHKELAEEIMEAQMSHESIRILGTFDEFSQILQRGKKIHTAGILELIMHLYDAPNVIVSPNKHSKARADYPTWGLIGCSTFNLIENALNTNYIGGGLTNRFEWYHGEAKRSMFAFGTPDIDKWTATVEELEAIRHRFTNPTSYTMTVESNAMGLEWLKQFEQQIKEVDHDFVVDSLKRQKILIMKNALIFSILRNDGTEIKPQDIEKAIILAEYTCNVVGMLFSNFHNSETKRVVNRIIEILKSKPRLSKRRIWQYMKWAEVRDVEESIDRLERMGILGVEKPKRTPLYLVIKGGLD